MITKKCTTCAEEKTVDNFYKDIRRYDGVSLQSWRAECKQCQAEHQKNNRAAANVRGRRYNKKHPWMQAQHMAERRIKERTPNQFPKWADRNFIKVFYIVAGMLTRTLKEKFEVDHIAPLRGANVSGLHVPQNLQILSISTNRSKGRQFNN